MFVCLLMRSLKYVGNKEGEARRGQPGRNVGNNRKMQGMCEEQQIELKCAKNTSSNSSSTLS